MAVGIVASGIGTSFSWAREVIRNANHFAQNCSVKDEIGDPWTISRTIGQTKSWQGSRSMDCDPIGISSPHIAAVDDDSIGLALGLDAEPNHPTVFGIVCDGGRYDRCDGAPMQRRGDGESQDLVCADWAEGYLCEEQHWPVRGAQDGCNPLDYGDLLGSY